MGKKSEKNKQPKTFLGSFTLPHGPSFVGELKLAGSKTSLRVHSDESFEYFGQDSSITGLSYSGKYITLIDCDCPGVGYTSVRDGMMRYHADIFAHHVVVGEQHIEPKSKNIGAMYFTTDDLPSLFYDSDAFGSISNAAHLMDSLLKERRGKCQINVGQYPHIQYFTGKRMIAKTNTSVGEITVEHWPSSNLGGPNGVFIKNKIYVSIVPKEPVDFNQALGHMHDMICFLSTAAGRTQRIKKIKITTVDSSDEVPHFLEVHSSLRWKVKASHYHQPHPRDVPLDPINRPSEFKKVLCDWFNRHEEWRTARVRYLGCQRKGNSYSIDRLVAAANMFDILPPDAVPRVINLSESLKKTRDECRRKFRDHPPGIDRDSAISALGRLGKPSLPKKILHRVELIDSTMQFPELQFVVGVGVKCRNYFVHGGGELDYSKLEQFVPFLTNALEFVFAASDLIEAGWDAAKWSKQLHGRGHSFSRFCSEYDDHLRGLMEVVKPAA